MVKKILGFAIVLVVTMSAIVYFSDLLMHKPALKPVAVIMENITDRKVNPTVKNDTIVIKTNEYSCGDTELYYRGPAPRELVGLDQNRLIMMYPKQEGWSLLFTPEEVMITRKMVGLCGMHHGYRHLGLYEGYLAIYQGPLGSEEILLRVEKNILVELLPESMQEQLHKTAYFSELSQDEQLALKNTMEFTDELAMNTTLENFDECSDFPR